MGLFRVADRVCVCVCVFDYVIAEGETQDAPSSSPCDPWSGRETRPCHVTLRSYPGSLV